MKRKFFACYIGLNSAQYLWYSIKSIYDFIKETDGKIIFIEGSTDYAIDVASDGNSIDNTKQILDDFIKDSEDNFIIYKRLGKVKDKRDLRNAYLDEVKKYADDNSWVIVVDDDELYKIEDLRRLNNFLDNNPNIEYIFNPQKWFWKDFSHICIPNEYEVHKQISTGKRSDKVFFDCVGNKIRQGQFHERFFKYNPGIRHINSHSIVTDSEGRDIYIDNFYESKRIIFNGCPRYHYGYLTTTNKMSHRFVYYQHRDANKPQTKREEVWNDSYGYYLLTGKLKNSAMTIFDYYGTHPEIIKEHPYFEKNSCPMNDEAEIIKKQFGDLK